MKKTVLCFMVFAIIFILGCDSPSPVAYKPAPNPIYTIKIISDPPGARIEVDDDYVGDAPIEIQVEGLADITLNSGTILHLADRTFAHYSTTISAIPIHPGQSVQTKIFWGGGKIPNTIFFDMNLSYAPRQYDLNIHND